MAVIRRRSVIALVGNLWWPVSITVLSARKVGPDEVRK